MKKREKGITLIALIITIIVLLILAGTTIATLTGENGLLTKAGEAKNATEKSALKEEINLMLLQAKMEDNLEIVFGKENINFDDTVYEITYKGEEFLISSDYEYIEKIEPQDKDEWKFDINTQTLTKYNYNIEEKRGSQEEGELIIPNYYNGVRVKVLNVSFYNNKNLKKVKISNGIKELKAWGTFCNCTNLTGDINLPDSLISMDNHAFSGCTSLDGELTLSKNLKKIGNQTFLNCNMLKGNINLPNVESIGNDAFMGCGSLNGNIEFGNKLQSIGDNAFNGCSKLTGNLIIPDSVISIGNYAFNGCSSLNGTLKMSNNISKIEKCTFQDCKSLTGNLIIPDNVTYIGDSAFAGCTSLSGTLKLSENLNKIDGWGSFYNCNKLTGDVVLSKNVQYVGAAFAGASSLNSIKFLNKETEITESTYFSPNNIKILCYEGSTAQQWAINNNRTYELISE